MNQTTKGANSKKSRVVNVQVVEGKGAPAPVPAPESSNVPAPVQEPEAAPATETPAPVHVEVGTNQDETPTNAQEIAAGDVEDLGTEPEQVAPSQPSDEEEGAEPPQPESGVELNLSPEADQFLSTLARFKREGLVELNKRQLQNPDGKYPPERVLELFQLQKLTLPSLEVLKEAGALIPGLRNPSKWAEMVDKGRARNSASVKSAVRQRYAL